jgi:hypothetical protein
MAEMLAKGDRWRIEIDREAGLISASLLNADGSVAKARVLDADEAREVGELLNREAASARSAGFPFVSVGRLLFPDDL